MSRCLSVLLATGGFESLVAYLILFFAACAIVSVFAAIAAAVAIASRRRRSASAVSLALSIMACLAATLLVNAAFSLTDGRGLLIIMSSLFPASLAAFSLTIAVSNIGKGKR